MDNFGDIIFFGAIIVAIVSNIVKYFKKEKQTLQKPVPTKLEDYFPKVEITKEIPVQKKKIVNHQQPVVANKQLKEIVIEEESLIEENNEFNMDFSDISEVKKGIISAEIFNRKY